MTEEESVFEGVCDSIRQTLEKPFQKLAEEMPWQVMMDYRSGGHNVFKRSDGSPMEYVGARRVKPLPTARRRGRPPNQFPKQLLIRFDRDLASF
jgi:hypothetical protein